MNLPDESNSELPDAFSRWWRLASLEDSSWRVKINSAPFQESFLSSICLYIFLSLCLWFISGSSPFCEPCWGDWWLGGRGNGKAAATALWCNSWHLHKDGEFRQPQGGGYSSGNPDFLSGNHLIFSEARRSLKEDWWQTFITTSGEPAYEQTLSLPLTRFLAPAQTTDKASFSLLFPSHSPLLRGLGLLQCQTSWVLPRRLLPCPSNRKERQTYYACSMYTSIHTCLRQYV